MNRQRERGGRWHADSDDMLCNDVAAESDVRAEDHVTQHTEPARIDEVDCQLTQVSVSTYLLLNL